MHAQGQERSVEQKNQYGVLVSILAKDNLIFFGIGIGIFFLLGGIAMNYMVYHPIFSPFDLILAYIPMGWLGAKLAKK